MPETRIDKAIRAIAQGRVRVVKADGAGIALTVRSEHFDVPTLADRTYTVALYVDPSDPDGLIVRECTCEHAKFHFRFPRCHHVAVAELLWRPATREETPCNP